MKAWAKTLGTLAAVGAFAPLGLAATWYAVERGIGSSESTVTDDGGQHGLAGQDMAVGNGLDLRRVMSSTRSISTAGHPAIPAASRELTLAAFEGSRLLAPANIILVESEAPAAPASVAAAADDGGAGASGAFAIFGSNAAGSPGMATAALAVAQPLGVLTRGAGMTRGPSGGGSAFAPDALQLLQASGTLGDSGTGPLIGGMPGFGGYDVTLQVTPLPPAILAFLSGLAALFAFRRARGKAGEPAIR